MTMFLDVAGQPPFVPSCLAQILSWKMKHLYLPFGLSVLLQQWHWFFQHKDAREDIGILKNRRVTKVDDAFEHTLFSKKSTQWFAIASTHPLVSDNIGHSPTYSN